MTKHQGRGAGRGVYGPGGKGRGKGKELSTSDGELHACGKCSEGSGDSWMYPLPTYPYHNPYV